MAASPIPTAPSSGRVIPAVVMLMALAATGLAGCAKSTPTAATAPGGTASGQASSGQASQASSGQASPTSTPATASGGGPADWCALAIQIDTHSGMMVNKHFVPPAQETREQLIAAVNESLTVRDQLLVGLPPAVRSAMEVTLQYFQALKDSGFAISTPVPAGLGGATTTMNQFETTQCGIVFDK